MENVERRYNKIVWQEGPDGEPHVARGSLVKIADGLVHWRFPDGQTIILGANAVVALKE